MVGVYALTVRAAAAVWLLVGAAGVGCEARVIDFPGQSLAEPPVDARADVPQSCAFTTTDGGTCAECRGSRSGQVGRHCLECNSTPEGNPGPSVTCYMCAWDDARDRQCLSCTDTAGKSVTEGCNHLREFLERDREGMQRPRG